MPLSARVTAKDWHGLERKTVGIGIVQAPSFGPDGRRDRQCKRSFSLQGEQLREFWCSLSRDAPARC